MRLSELDYHLPEDRIAQEPLAERDSSRLLVVDRRRRSFSHHRIGDLPALLAMGDLLVRNVSQVLPARLVARRPTGGRVEILLVRRMAPGRWLALARPLARIRPGEPLLLPDGESAQVELAPEEGPGFVYLQGTGTERAMWSSGTPPLPPYIRRPATTADRDRYQTVYAREPGSIAAPTAGLHFSPALLKRLAESGIGCADVVLHVGPGTFQPVRCQMVEEHQMHREWFAVPEETATAVRHARASGHRVIAVGTTAVRALESATSSGTIAATSGDTSLFLRPGVDLRAVSALLTNFHQPRTTLLALVATFTGVDLLRSAYAEALRCDYRFLSYGDAMLVL